MNATWNDLSVVCIAIVLDFVVAVAARWRTSEHQTCPNVVLPAGLSGFRTEEKQKRPCLRSLRASSPAVVCGSSGSLRDETHPEAEERGNEDQIQARVRLNRCLTFTLTGRDWHFFDRMAGSVPRRVNGGTVETAVGVGSCGPGTTRLSLGSSAG